jgi:hypothetical protein
MSSVAFCLIAEIGIAAGASPLTKHVGCWEHTIDDAWRLAVNGHRTPTRTTWGAEVPPIHAIVEHLGWPVAILSPYGGEVAGINGVTEDALIDVLAAECRRLGGTCETLGEETPDPAKGTAG